MLLLCIVFVIRPGGSSVGGLKDPDATCEESASLTGAPAGMWGNTRWVITYREHWIQVRTEPEAKHDQKWSCLQLGDLCCGNGQDMIKAKCKYDPLICFLHSFFFFPQVFGSTQTIWQLWILTSVCWCCIWPEHNFCAITFFFFFLIQLQAAEEHLDGFTQQKWSRSVLDILMSNMTLNSQFSFWCLMLHFCAI